MRWLTPSCAHPAFPLVSCPASQRSGNEASAEDATQEIFLKIWKSLPGFRGESSISTWLYRIAVNSTLGHLRKNRLRQFFSLDRLEHRPHFAQGGGILFVPSKWPEQQVAPVTAEPYLLFIVRALGKGRLAVCKQDEPDSYDTVADIQNVISHRNDVLRLYNAPSMNFLYQTSVQGGQAVIHLMNYSRRPASDGPLFYVREPHKSARLVSPEIASVAELQFAPQEAGGAELSLPRLSVYGAVEMEK